VVEHIWNDIDNGMPKEWQRKPTQCYFSNHKTATEWPGIKHRPPN